jgi:hypothetical protein
VSDKVWKQRERLIAEKYFNSKRNPLSGQNNRGDDLKPRKGDVIYPYALVEIKLRKRNAVLERAKQTQEQAGEDKWVHIETIGGDRKLFAVVVPPEVFGGVIALLRNWFEKDCILGEGHDMLLDMYNNCPQCVDRYDRCFTCRKILVYLARVCPHGASGMDELVGENYTKRRKLYDLPSTPTGGVQADTGEGESNPPIPIRGGGPG